MNNFYLYECTICNDIIKTDNHISRSPKIPSHIQKHNKNFDNYSELFRIPEIPNICQTCGCHVSGKEKICTECCEDIAKS